MVAGHEQPGAPVTESTRAGSPWHSDISQIGRCPNRSPATYRDSTITSQPKPPNKNKSRNTVSLTPAETRVLALLTTYQTLAGIGSQLGIARPTVKTHVQNIYKKLGATKRAEAVRLAESAGLLPDGGVLRSRKDSRWR